MYNKENQAVCSVCVHGSVFTRAVFTGAVWVLTEHALQLDHTYVSHSILIYIVCMSFPVSASLSQNSFNFMP